MTLGYFGTSFDIAKTGSVNLTSSVQPSSANELANKSYVDAAIAAGGGDWFASVLDQLNAAPASPAAGARYLVGAAGSGAWASNSNDVAVYNGGANPSTTAGSWDYTSPSKGSHVYLEDTGQTMVFSGTAWVVAGSATGALIATNNLSDLTNASDARSNLGLGSLATESSVDLGSEVSGTLPIANGGTGSSTAPMVGLITAADASAARTVIGAGTIATQDSDAVSITGGSITGITDLAVADGGTGASDAASARSNLGAQAQNALLDDIAGLTIADGTFLVGDANGDIVAESGATVRTSLGLGTAATDDTGVAAGNIVKLDKALAANELIGLKQDSAINVTSATNLNYLYSGGTWEVKDTSSNVVASGSVVDIDSTNTRVFVSYTTGSSYSISAGFTFHASGYQWTTSSTPTDNVNRLRGLNSSGVKEIIGNAGTSNQAAGSTKGVASFDNSIFNSSNGFISLATGLTRGKVPTFLETVAVGDIVKAAHFSNSASGNFISSGAIDASAKTVKTQVSAVANIVAGQTMSSSGYDFEVVSVSSDGQSTPTFTITVLDPSSNLQYLYNSGTFEIFSGSGFISAGAYGTAANQNMATGIGSSAQGRMLKVSSSASLAADSLLAINSSGEIIAGSAGQQGTVTSISLEDANGDTTSAITTSGSIAVVGDGTVVTTDINGSSQLEISVATASTTAAGVAKKASSSTPGGDNVFVGFDSSVSSGSFDQGLMPLINADGEITFSSGSGFYKSTGSSASLVTPTGYDLDGPLVKKASGILDGTASLPSSVSSLEGAYIYDLGSISSDVGLTLPTSFSASDIGATVTFKVQSLAATKKITISGGQLNGQRMTIDGFDSIDIDQARMGVTLHLSAVFAGATPSADKLCWSII